MLPLQPRRGFSVVILLAAVAAAEAPTGNAPMEAVSQELRRVESAQARGQVDALRIEYQELVRQKPGDVLARVYLAWCSMPSDDAWNQLKGLVSVNPDHPWLHYGMGRVYTSWKMRDQARAEFDLVLKVNPKFYPVLIGLGDLARQKEDWAEAEKQYRAALALGSDPLAYTGLGYVMLGQGKTDDARAHFKKSTAAWPEQPQVLATLLKLCLEAKDPETADVAARLAEVQPKNREALRVLADLRFDAGDKKAAADGYERLFKLGGAEPAMVKRLATLYREASDADGEERMVQLLSTLDKTSPDAPLRLSELRLAKKDVPGAQTQLQEVIARDPNHAEAHLRLARMKVEQKALCEAAELYRAAAALEGPSAETAKKEGAKLEADFDLPKKSLTGDVNTLYAKVSFTLGKVFEKRVLKKRGLNGVLKMRVRVNKEGVVEGVDVLEDTAGDPVLTAHAYFALKDATFPKQKRDPVFEFEVGKQRGK